MIKTQLPETSGTNLLQHRMPRNLKLSHVPKSHTLSRETILTIRNLSWLKSKDKILTSLLTATTMKMNMKYCQASPSTLKGREKERKLVVNVFEVSRMSEQVSILGLKYWKLRVHSTKIT